MRLLLIEDDEILGEGLSGFLRADGHAVDWCRTLEETRAYRHEPYDAWLVDWQLPDGSGLDWLRTRRSRQETTAALILTARDLLRDRIEGLDTGADDYLVKPFAPEELAARLRALGRRLAGTATPRMRLPGAEIDLAARAAYVEGRRIDLTRREWAVLETLALRPGRIVSQADLERAALGFQFDVASNVIEVHVSSLRRKLGRDVIETVRGLGYRIGAA